MDQKKIDEPEQEFSVDTESNDVHFESERVVHSKFAKLGLIAASVFAFIIVAGVIWFLYQPPALEPVTDDVEPVDNRPSITQMREDNEEYQRAGELLDANRFTEAKEAFRLLLVEEENLTPGQESQLLFKYAVATRYEDGEVEAVPFFQQIALNENYPIRNRGNAVEYLGRMYYNSLDPELYDAILSGPAPFSNFKDEAEIDRELYGQDQANPFKNLYEFASSLYPTAEGEFRLATFYIDDLKAVKQRVANGESVPEGLVDSIRAEIAEKITQGKADLDRLAEADFYDLRHERGVLGLAKVLGSLELIGEAGDLGDAEETYNEALKMFALRGPYIGQFVNINYAIFLAQRNEPGDLEKTRSLLDQFYVPAAERSYQGVYDFVAERESVYRSNLDGELMVLAEADPRFKELMLAQGWEQEDFDAAGI